MAQVTVELGQLITMTDFELFDFTYQFDDTIFKEQLEKAVTDYYFFSEIGQETPDRFKQRFRTRWERIIPYYNKLYNSTLLDYDPLTNQKLTETLDQLATTNTTMTNDLASSDTNTVKNTGTNTVADSGTSHVTNTGTETTTDYPQQPIAGGNYASGAKSTSTTTDGTTTDNVTTTLNTTITTTDTGTNTGTVKNNGTIDTDYTKTIAGITGVSYPELIQKHRDALLRISDRIIEELKPCFILVY